MCGDWRSPSKSVTLDSQGWAVKNGFKSEGGGIVESCGWEGEKKRILSVIKKRTGVSHPRTPTERMR